jgi:hypothetical protein
VHALRGLLYMPHQLYAQQIAMLWRWIPLFCLPAVKFFTRFYARRMRTEKMMLE